MRQRSHPVGSAVHGAVGGRVRTIAIGVSVLLVGLVPAACGTASAGGGSGTLVLYNAQHEQTTDALIAAFTKQTGIQVKVDNDDEDVLTAQIEQEGNRSPADVFFTENSNWLQQLDDRGMLAQVDPATLAAVPAQDNATNGRWLGVSGRVSVLAYNPSKISAAQLPKSVLDMADPQYQGKLEIAPSETDFWPIVSSVDRTYGNAATLTWLKGLAANAGSGDNVPDNETLVSDISKGVTDFGLINHYYFYRLEAEVGANNVHAKLAYFTPRDPGYVEDISGAAILKSSTNQAAAQKFLGFLTSAQGQTILAHSDSFEYPLRAGVTPNSALTALNQLQPTDFSMADLGTGLNAKQLLQQAGLL